MRYSYRSYAWFPGVFIQTFESQTQEGLWCQQLVCLMRNSTSHLFFEQSQQEAIAVHALLFVVMLWHAFKREKSQCKNSRVHFYQGCMPQGISVWNALEDIQPSYEGKFKFTRFQKFTGCVKEHVCMQFIFRSMHKLLMDTSTSEYLFCIEFFQDDTVYLELIASTQAVVESSLVLQLQVNLCQLSSDSLISRYRV